MTAMSAHEARRQLVVACSLILRFIEDPELSMAIALELAEETTA